MSNETEYTWPWAKEAGQTSIAFTGFNQPHDEFREELDAIYALHNAKRSDYTGDKQDRLANYRHSALMMGVPIEVAMLGRLSEKLFRLKSIYGKGGQVAVLDETVGDTLRDICIISLLMKLSMQGGEYAKPNGE